MNILQFVDNKVVGYGNLAGYSDANGEKEIVNKEVSIEVFNAAKGDSRKYILVNNEVVENPEYESEVAQELQDKVNRLKMTSLDLIKIVKSFGLTDEDVEEFLKANIGIKHELEFCQNVYCGIVKSFCPITIKNFELTAQMVEDMFIRKNATEEQE